MTVRMIVVPILQETNELEALIAAVQTAKGSDDYGIDPEDAIQERRN